SLIQDTLASSGYNVITCKDGGEAHEKLMSLIEVAKEENLPVPEEPLPTLELLYHPEKRENFIDRDALEQVARLVESKLADYKIKADVVGIYPGPVITRFELDLAPGVKVSRIS
ncbi:DNA translocase FtsK, partial [Vibrio parahaemolyticus]|uniref:DNA translocase FtsK n=1 Tax=Vibrio parahaemolyticus TaxID=670 RepID=UPI00201D33BF